jgi:hypothetical protein
MEYNKEETMDKFKKRLLTKIDNLQGFYAKLEFLNNQFLKTKTEEQENIILEMIEQLKFWGK